MVKLPVSLNKSSLWHYFSNCQEVGQQGVGLPLHLLSFQITPNYALSLVLFQPKTSRLKDYQYKPLMSSVQAFRFPWQKAKASGFSLSARMKASRPGRGSIGVLLLCAWLVFPGSYCYCCFLINDTDRDRVIHSARGKEWGGGVLKGRRGGRKEGKKQGEKLVTFLCYFVQKWKKKFV